MFGVRLFRGSITSAGTTRELEPIDWTGLGVSFKLIHAEVEVECAKPNAIGFTKGDKIRLVGVTLLLLSAVRVTVKVHCDPGGDYHEDSDTSFGLGIGLEGFVSTWQVG